MPLKVSSRTVKRGEKLYSMDVARIGRTSKRSGRPHRATWSSNTSARLNSILRATAEPSEQSKFVDGVGPRQLYDAAPQDHRDAFFASLIWPAPGSEDTELGVLMGPEVSHGATKVYAGVQA